MSNFQKNSKNYGEPDITYHLAGAAEQRPTMPRIPGIGARNRPSGLGFQESDLDGTHDGIGFQESELVCNKERMFFRNLYFRTVSRSPSTRKL